MPTISNFFGEILFCLMLYPALIPAHIAFIYFTNRAWKDWSGPGGAWEDRPTFKAFRFFMILEGIGFVLFWGSIKSGMFKIHV